MVLKMIKINEVIIVEGKYDKIKLKSIIDGTILETDGFSIYKNREKFNLIRQIAEKRGIIILTDSDRAGFQIRSYLCGGIDGKYIKNAYIPDIKGKEKRKRSFSKEGFLGVEGVTPEIIINALKTAGALLDKENVEQRKITKADFYEDGLSGSENSVALRRELLNKLCLPAAMPSGRLIEVLNILISFDEYKKTVKEIKEQNT